MRVAIVSDIHANQTAFEAALADLRQVSPDLILHDLADAGSSQSGPRPGKSPLPRGRAGRRAPCMAAPAPALGHASLDGRTRP